MPEVEAIQLHYIGPGDNGIADETALRRASAISVNIQWLTPPVLAAKSGERWNRIKGKL